MQRKSAQEILDRADAVAAGARDEAESLLIAARRAIVDVSGGFFDLGEAFTKLREPRIYRALGYSSFQALLKGEFEASRAYAYGLMAIARGLRRESAVALGPARSAALVRLAAITPAFDTAESLLRSRVRVHGRRAKVGVSELTLDELRRLVRDGIHRRRPKGARVGREARAAALALAVRLREQIEEAGIADARVRVVEHRGHTETLHLRVDFAIGACAQVGKVLAKAATPRSQK